jgi:copper homeostasis protein (lipoprotein)
MHAGPWIRGACLAGALMAPACGGPQEQPAAQQAPVFKPVDPATMSAALFATGTMRFAGVLPCADCAGIRTELTLVQDPRSGEPQTYELKETYLGSMSVDGEKTFTSNGRWSIARGTADDATLTVYRLDGGGKAEAARSFERVNDQELRMLDREQKRISSTLNYTLMRVADPAPVVGMPPASAPLGNQPAAMVTDLASGWPIALRVGQPMTARLAADRAAGGRWSLRAGSDGGIVMREGEPAYEPSQKGGVEVFTLKAVKPGSPTLTFDYKQGSAADALRSVSYPVTVQ